MMMGSPSEPKAEPGAGRGTAKDRGLLQYRPSSVHVDFHGYRFVFEPDGEPKSGPAVD
jgi:hypothetical protein